MTVGDICGGNQVIISNGGVVMDDQGAIGLQNGSASNTVVVTDPGSLWSNTGTLYVGHQGRADQLLVSNGGVVANVNAYLGATVDAHDNLVIVSGAGSLWTNTGYIYLGQNAFRSQLVVSNGGTVYTTNVWIGFSGGADDRLVMDGGSLLVPLGALDIRRGTNVFNSGLIVADQLVLNTGTGFFEFSGGTLNARSPATWPMPWHSPWATAAAPQPIA